MKASVAVSLLSSLLTTSAVAQNVLFVGDYGGNINTVSFNNETGNIKQLSANKDSAPSPSWQEVSANKKFLYSIEETTKKNESMGALTSYSIAEDGSLKKVASAEGQASPVSLGINPDQNLILTAN